jgi:hypothetical protein
MVKSGCFLPVSTMAATDAFPNSWLRRFPRLALSLGSMAHSMFTNCSQCLLAAPNSSSLNALESGMRSDRRQYRRSCAVSVNTVPFFCCCRPTSVSTTSLQQLSLSRPIFTSSEKAASAPSASPAAFMATPTKALASANWVTVR